VPPATLRILANATVAPIGEEVREADRAQTSQLGRPSTTPNLGL